MSLEAGQEASATFLITWHFPRLEMLKWHFERLETLKDTGRYYATRFPSAAAVAEHVASHFASLHAQTRLWHDTWYDSTLPYWFLDRTMLNTSSLAMQCLIKMDKGDGLLEGAQHNTLDAA